MKRIFSMICIGVMLCATVALAGCGDKKGGSAPVPGKKGGVAEDSEELFFLDMPSELKGTTVKLAGWGTPKDGNSGEVISEFEQQTGIKVESVHVSQADYIVKLSALINADQSPDVVVENGDFPRTLNVLMPITKEETGIDVTDPFWNQQVIRQFTVGKSPYLVEGVKSCWNMAGSMVYFNRTTLAENNIKSPNDYVAENNWNLDTFRTLMQQVQAIGAYRGAATQVKETDICKMFGGLQISWDPSAGKFSNVLDSDANTKAYKWMLERKEEGLLEIVTDWGSKLGTGDAAISLCGAYGLRVKPGWFYQMDVDDLGFEVLPKVSASDADYPYLCSTHAYGICKGSKNPKGAGYYLRYYLNEDRYDLTQMFKSDEALKLYRTLREKASYDLCDYSRGVRMTVYGDDHSGSMASVALSGTADQVRVNLAASSNTVQACVDKANELVAEVIAGQ